MLLFTIELVFGFSPSKHETRESDESVTVNVFFIHGIPGDYQPIVLISIHNGTATGQQIFHKIIIVNDLLIMVYYRRDRFCYLSIFGGHFYYWKPSPTSSHTYHFH